MSKAKLIGSAIMGLIMILDYALVPSFAAGQSYCVLPARIASAMVEQTKETWEKPDGDIFVGHYKRRLPRKPYTDEELELLACVIYCEAGGDEASDETRRMVGEVVLNRVADERYPNTIYEVLTQKSQYGRFYWTGVVWPSRAKHEPEAVERAYECAKLVFTAERLLPKDTVYQAEFKQGEVVASAPGFWFCR